MFNSYSRLIIIMELKEFTNTILPLRNKLVKIAKSFTKQKEDAEDIVQDAFLKLWHVRNKLKQYNSIEALSVTITKNLALDHYRKRKYNENLDTVINISNENYIPSRQLEQKETISNIESFISCLPELQRQIIKLKDIEGYEIDEIAKMLNSTPEAIRVNLSRARKKLREYLISINIR